MTTPANPAAILDTIDNAIADYEISADAMRWTPDPQPATGGPIAGPDLARLFDVPPGFITLPRIVGPSPEVLAQMAARITATLEPIRRAADAMKGMSLALAPLFDEVYWGKPRRPERVSQIRRAYRAKRRGW